jgi:hypothetical protein
LIANSIRIIKRFFLCHSKYEVKASADDVRNNVCLIKLFSERDPAIAKSEV